MDKNLFHRQTIQERATCYAERHELAELQLRGLGGSYGYSRVRNAEMNGYIKGATDQQSLQEDLLKAAHTEWLDKACEWLYDYLYPRTDINLEEFLGEFRMSYTDKEILNKCIK